MRHPIIVSLIYILFLPGLAVLAAESVAAESFDVASPAVAAPPVASAPEWNLAILRKIDSDPEFGLKARLPGGKKSSGKFKSLVNFMFDTRGIDWSKEGADLALDRGMEVTSGQTAVYHEQIERYSLHWQVVSAIARLAESLGSPTSSADSTSARISVDAVGQLRRLIGNEQTDEAVRWLSGRELDSARQELAAVDHMDLSSTMDAEDVLLPAAVDHDAVISTFKKALTPYADKAKGRRMATKVAYSTLGAAAFIPNMIAPIAETSFLTTMMSNGGPEQDKLLKELYFSKLIERRRELIERELYLALTARTVSVASKNPSLYKFSRALIDYLCGENAESGLFAGAPQAGL